MLSDFSFSIPVRGHISALQSEFKTSAAGPVEKAKQEQIIFIFCQIVSDDYLSRQVINELQEMDLYLTGGEYVTMVTWSRQGEIRSRR